MIFIKVNIIKFIDHNQPGFVEAKFTDAFGQEHLFNEKVPVLTEAILDAESHYPTIGFIGCEIVGEYKDDKGRVIVTVSTERPWGVESTKGIQIFDITKSQLNPVQ